MQQWAESMNTTSRHFHSEQNSPAPEILLCVIDWVADINSTEYFLKTLSV